MFIPTVWSRRAPAVGFFSYCSYVFVINYPNLQKTKVFVINYPNLQKTKVFVMLAVYKPHQTVAAYVAVGKIDTLEVDFVAQSADEKL